jgi:predicted nucleic acid-binding protein
MNGMTDLEAQGGIYLETNVFIYATEGTRETADPAKRLLEALRHRPGLAITSEITLAETLAPPKREDALPLHIKRRVYLDLLVRGGFIDLVPVSRGVLIETADLRSVVRLNLPDAIHLVSAIRSKCRFIVSHDRDFKKLPAEMTRVTPDESGISDLLRVIA